MSKNLLIRVNSYQLVVTKQPNVLCLRGYVTLSKERMFFEVLLRQNYNNQLVDL